MQLQRYLLKNKKKGVPFGEHFKENTWDYEWYMGENIIGIKNNPSTEAEAFMSEFLIREDKLIITPSKMLPVIARRSDSIGAMSGEDSGIKEVRDLLTLIQLQETTHVYQSSEYEDGRNPRILTFSQRTPPKELFNYSKIMPIKIKPEADYSELISHINYYTKKVRSKLMVYEK